MGETLPIRPRIVIEFGGEHSSAAGLRIEGSVDRGQRMIATALLEQWDRDMHAGEMVQAAQQQRDLVNVVQDIRARRTQGNGIDRQPSR